MSIKINEKKEQGIIVEGWQIFYLIYFDGTEVCYLQKDGNNGIEQAFNLNS